MKKVAILWDLDGTLLDTLEDLKDAANYALRQFGCPERSLEEVRRFVGNGAGLLIRRALPGTECDPDPEEVLACFRTYYDAHCQIKTGPYPGILETLAQLKAEGYPMAVVSNKPDSAVQILCRDYFSDLVQHTQGEIAGTPRKPAPDMAWLAAKKLGIDPAHCIYVGDSEVDVQTARAAGMTGLAVTWGFRDMDVMKAEGAVHFCHDPADLPKMIRQLEEKVHGQ